MDAPGRGEAPDQVDRCMQRGGRIIGLSDGLRRLRGVAQVRAQQDQSLPVVAQLRAQRLRCALVAVGDHAAVALREQARGHRSSEPARAARDHDAQHRLDPTPPVRLRPGAAIPCDGASQRSEARQRGRSSACRQACGALYRAQRPALPAGGARRSQWRRAGDGLGGSRGDRGAAQLRASLRVRGQYAVHPDYGPEIRLSEISPAAPGSYSEEELGGAPGRSVAELERELRELLASLRDEHLRALLALAFDPQGELWQRFREAPAAKRLHEAYRHGLLEHTLTVARAVAAIAPTLPGCDRDLALAGALLHDIGKLDAYALAAGSIEMTDEGRLLGEIALGYRRVGVLLARVDGFPADRARALLHIILSHHGSLEHGSPVLPATREATLVHMIDNLAGRLGSFERLARELAPGHAWSQFDRALGTAAYFGLAA